MVANYIKSSSSRLPRVFPGSAACSKVQIDPQLTIARSRGHRSIDVFQAIDPSRATWDYIRQLEAEVSLLFGDDAVEVPGTRKLLDSPQHLRAKWGTVTCCTKPLVVGWMKVLELLMPRCIVTAEDLQKGKQFQNVTTLVWRCWTWRLLAVSAQVVALDQTFWCWRMRLLMPRQGRR